MNNGLAAIAIAIAAALQISGTNIDELCAEDDYWLEEETEEQARERMTPAEAEADRKYAACHVRHADLPYGRTCPACGEE